jgi:nitroreductase
VDEIGLFEAMYSQLQITRYRRDPVPIELIEQVIDAATMAPNGNNGQPWEFVVVTDPALVEHIGTIYREAWLDMMGRTPPPDESAAHRAARRLAEHMPEVPAIILVCADHTRGPRNFKLGDPVVRGRVGGSIFPAVQNLFLAARALGLGTRLTMVHGQREPELRELLGMPEHVEIVVLTPIG